MGDSKNSKMEVDTASIGDPTEIESTKGSEKMNTMHFAFRSTDNLLSMAENQEKHQEQLNSIKIKRMSRYRIHDASLGSHANCVSMDNEFRNQIKTAPDEIKPCAPHTDPLRRKIITSAYHKPAPKGGVPIYVSHHDPKGGVPLRVSSMILKEGCLLI